jgi:hypothetical protein
MNQTTPSLRWLNSKPKYMNRKMNSHPHTMTLESGVLNVYIIVCSGFVIHRLMKCISSQSLNHHTGRDQSLLILTVCVWNKERLFLLSLSHSKRNISLVVSFLAWINFLSWKILTMITSHTRGKWKFQLKKNDEKTVRKPKRQKSPKNSNARRHTQITRNNDSQNKVNMPWPTQWKGANQRRVTKEKMKDTNSRTVDSDPWSLKPWNTLWALWIIFFHSQKPQPTLRACRSPF